MEQTLLTYLSDIWKVLPEQGTEEWLSAKSYSIGGTEIGKLRLASKKDIIKRKTGLSESFNSLPMMMGNVLEHLTQAVTSIMCRCKIHDAPGNIPSCEVVGKTYSPDGLGIFESLITLFEFKTMWSRIPVQNVVYKTYIPQIKSGLADLDITSHGIYSEAYFRICSWDALMDPESCSYNCKFHYSDMPYNKVLMDGYLVFYFNNDYSKLDNKELYMIESLIDECQLMDWGEHGTSETIFKLFYLIKNKIISVHTSCVNTYPQNFDNVSWSKEHPVIKLSTTHDRSKIENSIKKNINLGHMPWKLFDVNIVKVEKEKGYTLQFKDDIEKTLEEIKKLNEIEDVEKRYDEFGIKYLGVTTMDNVDKNNEAYLLSLYDNPIINGNTNQRA